MNLPPAVRYAIIPCGGQGTRMRGLTGGGPKEMLALGGEPVIGRVSRECGASGISDLCVVIAPGKESIRDYLGPMAGKPGYPQRIDFVEQPTPRGLADAIRLGWGAPDRPVAVALPDNVFVDGMPAMQQVIASYCRSGKNTIAIVAISAAEAASRGPTPVYRGRERGDDFEIAAIPSKGDHATTFETGGAATAYTGVGRYVLLSDAYQIIDELERTAPLGRERDDIPVLQRLLTMGRLSGCVIRGDFLDVGLPTGYRHAAARLARASAAAAGRM